jgi:hypothetical protein
VPVAVFRTCAHNVPQANSAVVKLTILVNVFMSFLEVNVLGGIFDIWIPLIPRVGQNEAGLEANLKGT